MPDPHRALTGATGRSDADSPNPAPAPPVTAPPDLDIATTPDRDLPPTLDADGLLRHRGRWVPIPDTQLAVVDLLVRNLGRLVGTSEVRKAYEQAGGSGTSTSLRSLIHRLGRRVSQVGLRLHVVRSRGLVLDVAWPA